MYHHTLDSGEASSITIDFSVRIAEPPKKLLNGRVWRDSGLVNTWRSQEGEAPARAWTLHALPHSPVRLFRLAVPEFHPL